MAPPYDPDQRDGGDRKGHRHIAAAVVQELLHSHVLGRPNGLLASLSRNAQ